MNDPRETVVTLPQAEDAIRFPLRLAAARNRFRVFNPEVRAATHRRIAEASALSSCNPHNGFTIAPPTPTAKKPGSTVSRRVPATPHRQPSSSAPFGRQGVVSY